MAAEGEITGLQQLSKQQLIDIILRKDDVERKLRRYIHQLEKSNSQLEKDIATYERILNPKIIRLWQKLR